MYRYVYNIHRKWKSKGTYWIPTLRDERVHCEYDGIKGMNYGGGGVGKCQQRTKQHTVINFPDEWFSTQKLLKWLE